MKISLLTRLGCAVFLALATLPAAGDKSATLDDGKLDPTWFGEGVTFRELDEVDYFWVVGSFELAGKSVFFSPWAEPEFLGPKAANRDAKDHDLAKRMNSDMPDLFRQAFAETYGDRLTPALGDAADVRVEGRIVDVSTGSTAAKVLVGFGAGSGNITIDLRFVDTRSGAILAGLHHRVVSGSVYTTSDSKFISWVEDLAEDLAKKGFVKLYAKGDKVDDSTTMATVGSTLFDTAIGVVGIAWSERGFVAVQLPEATREATARRLARRGSLPSEVPPASGTSPPPPVKLAIEDMTRLLAGEKVDLQRVPIELDPVPEFDRRVYEIARTIPPGETLTYGAIAMRLGQPGAAREVGQALGRNPFPLVVPCHRVVAAGGKLGGFSAAQGAITKRRLLEIEGAFTQGTLPLFSLP